MFLTEAFRRLIFRHTATADERMEFDDLVRLLTASIFGVDKSLISVGVAALAYISLCLKQIDSELVWESARLPLMVGQNLIVSDFLRSSAQRSRHLTSLLATRHGAANYPNRLNSMSRIRRYQFRISKSLWCSYMPRQDALPHWCARIPHAVKGIAPQSLKAG